MQKQATEPLKKTHADWSWPRWLLGTILLTALSFLIRLSLTTQRVDAPLLKDPSWHLFLFGPIAATVFCGIGYLDKRLKVSPSPRFALGVKCFGEGLETTTLAYLAAGTQYAALLPLCALVSALATYCGHSLAERKPSQAS